MRAPPTSSAPSLHSDHDPLVRPIEGDATNVAEHVRRAIARQPESIAFIVPSAGGTRQLSFAEFGALFDRFTAGLEALGLPRGARLILLAPPTVEIYALALATLRAGHALVTVDGRSDAARIRHALGEAAADIVVGAPRLMRWWPFVPALRRARRFTAGQPVFGTRGLTELLDASGAPAPLPDPVDPDSDAVVAFTSGNTGVAKRVVRTHAVLSAQHRALVDAFPLHESGVNLPGFPLAVLHNLCRGATTALPSVDLRSMADADVATVLQTMRDHRVTSISAAPAFIRRVAAHLLSHGESLPQIRLIVVGGGPVSRRLAADVLSAFPLADARVVYGATEAEPIATARLREIVEADHAAEGYLAGWPVAGTEIHLAGGDDRGELIVRGPQVIAPALTGGWHRTGDICQRDAAGRLWLVGRIGAEVEHGGRVVHPFVVEAHVADQPGVAAAALVAHRGAPQGELLVEVAAGADEDIVIESARGALQAIGLGTVSVRPIDVVPMDARHCSKVDRATLIRRLERGGR